MMTVYLKLNYVKIGRIPTSSGVALEFQHIKYSSRVAHCVKGSVCTIHVKLVILQDNYEVQLINTF